MSPLIAAWLIAAPASAADGLAWEWASPRRYLLDLDLLVPRPLTLQAENNYEVRVPILSVQVDTECAAVDPRKSGFDLKCTLTDLSLAAMPLERDAEHHVVEILDDVESRMKNAYMQISLAADGRIRALDLEGMETKNINDRVRTSQEVMRLVLARAFSAFDLLLPKNGSVAVGTAWKQTGSEISGFPSMAGSSGFVELDHQVARANGTVVTVTTKGGGVAGPSDVVNVGGTERIANQYDLVVSGWTNFDLAEHAITGRQIEVSGPPTASSVDSGAGSGNPYVQRVKLTRIKPGDPAPQLGPNEEMAQPD